nr:MarR family transcriptional regulator [uncultured Anaeromusa sp.]
MRQGNAIALCSRIAEAAHKQIIQELKKRGIEGIVPSHGGIMQLLFGGKEYTMQELARKIHRSKPTVTVLVEKLEAFGYVQRRKSSEDGRITLLRLTDKGQALELVFREISEVVNYRVYAELSEEEAEEVERLLSKVKLNFCPTIC